MYSSPAQQFFSGNFDLHNSFTIICTYAADYVKTLLFIARLWKKRYKNVHNICTHESWSRPFNQLHSQICPSRSRVFGGTYDGTLRRRSECGPLAPECAVCCERLWTKSLGAQMAMYNEQNLTQSLRGCMCKQCRYQLCKRDIRRIRNHEIFM